MMIHKTFNVELKFPKETYERLLSLKDYEGLTVPINTEDLKIILQIFDLLDKTSDSPTKISVVS